MSFWKKFLKVILFPHIAVVVALVPIAAAMLIYAFVFAGSDSVVSYVSYVISAYTLTVVCFRIPNMIRFVKYLKNENRLVRRLTEDAHLRVKISLYGSFLFNTAYAAFQMALGFYNRSLWFHSMAAYYFLLALMRFFLLKHTRSYTPGEKMEAELRRYRFCGVVLLVLNAVLAVIITYTVLLGKVTKHHPIITIAMAAFTFTSLTVAIINVVRYRRYNSPVFTASKDISLAVAVVSMLTLETSMLSAFGDGTVDETFVLAITATSGFAVSVFVLGLAIYMIVRSGKRLRALRESKGFKISHD